MGVLWASDDAPCRGHVTEGMYSSSSCTSEINSKYLTAQSFVVDAVWKTETKQVLKVKIIYENLKKESEL